MSFDSVPTENSTNMVNSGTVYSALDLKADKSTTYTKTETDTQISTAVSNLVNSAPSTLDTLEELADALGDDPNFATTIATQLGLKADKSNTYTKTEVDTALNAKADQSTTYTKTEVDTALSNVQSTLTFDNVPTANSDNPVKSSGIKTALDGKQNTLTFDSTPTANSTNPVTSGGVYTALQNVNIDIDDEITEDSDNPVTSAAIYEALQNIPSGGGSGGGTTYTAGDGIDITNDEISLETASANSIGGIKVGSGLAIDANGVLSSDGEKAYNLYTRNENTSFSKSGNTGYISQTAGEKVGCIYNESGTWFNVYKTNSNPAIFGICTITNESGFSVIMASQIEDAVKCTSNGVSASVESLGSIFDSTSNAEWYYSRARISTGRLVTDGGLKTSDGKLKLKDIVGTGFSSIETAVLKLLELAQVSVTSIPILQDMFYPTNYTFSSGDTISLNQQNNALRSLILGKRPIRINNETYYFVKLDNGTYYYENPNNTITIDSSWVMTITAKSSGGGSSITVDSTITQGGTNPVEGGAIYTALDTKADKSTTYTKTEVDTAISSKGDVTTDTNQNITGTKTFVGSKKVAFKQSSANDKLGFTLYSNSNAERGYLEFNPTNTVDGVAGLMTLGNYATSAASLTQVGFRRYSNISGASGAYNLLMPMVADARTPFSLTTSYTNFYLPLGFTDGTTTVKTAKSGVVDLSPLLASLEARIAALEGN